MECAMCMYETEFEHSEDPYDNQVHPFTQQFQNSYKGIRELILNYFLSYSDKQPT